jgi:Uma2 family endonuclease
MSGASLAHNRINSNLVRELGVQLRDKPCDVFAQDLKTRTTPARFSYPDVIVICGEPEFLDENQDVVTNPTVIIEILSPSTEAYDRGGKFAAYQQSASFQEYVLVAQDRIAVEHYIRREGNLWLYERLDQPDGKLILPSVGCEVALSDIYYRVDVTGRAEL